MKLQEYETDNENNPKFNGKRFHEYWKTMVNHYKNSTYKDFDNKLNEKRQKASIVRMHSIRKGYF
jgi:hypothetical protein